MNSERPQHRDPLKYLKKWGRDESFYRDIATRTLSILISSVFVYVGALLLGYARRPETAALFWIGVVTAVSAVLVCVYRKVDAGIDERAAKHFEALARKEDKEIGSYQGRREAWEFNRSLFALGALVIAIMVMVGLVLAFYGPEPQEPITEGLSFLAEQQA
ncbi:hypothetical protein [Rhodococcoides kyotonense]|uniref:Uncharacterized protein n=1 Tax=Rhodococcoides kyotonense TaxID=398843 RepID=A0A239MVY8_9NOCA|nr:hypothetical protein [Rhodococcus kyotonensis]SNT46670.1 hypothetical protein SAMN05421642_12344 [Rhodococcus kyotonensis]